MADMFETSLRDERQNDSRIVLLHTYGTSEPSNVYIVGSYMMNSVVKLRASMDLDLHGEHVVPSWTAITSSDTRQRQRFVPSNLVKDLGIKRLRKLFLMLRDDWKTDLEFVSSATKIVNHPSYQFIIALGPVMVPFIIEDLRSESNHWFHALRTLTGHVPEKKYRGNMGTMRSAWLLWAEDNENYLQGLRNSVETD